MYKAVQIGVRNLKNKETMHSTLEQAKRHLLRTLKPHQPGWIVRVSGGKEHMLPGQYEVHEMLETGFKPALYLRKDKPNRLGRKPIMVRK